MADKFETRRSSLIRPSSPPVRQFRKIPVHPDDPIERPAGQFQELKLLFHQLGAELTSLLTDAAVVTEDTDSRSVSSLLNMDERLAHLSGVMKSALQHVRNVSNEIQPLIVTEIRPDVVIERVLRDMRNRLGIDYSFSSTSDFTAIGIDCAGTLLRLLRLILACIESYGWTTCVAVAITIENGAWIRLDVTDNGGGITEKRIADSQSLTLLLIHERARLAGGDCIITDHGTTGTRYRIMLPASYARGN